MWCAEAACGLDSEYAAVQAPLNGTGRHQSRRKGMQGLPARGRPVAYSVEHDVICTLT